MKDGAILDKARLYLGVQAACFLIAAGAVIASHAPAATATTSTTPTGGVRADVEAVAVDDSVDLLAPAAVPPPPAGVALLDELTGPDSERRHYARLVLQPGETFPAALARLAPWLAALRLPAGTRLAWERERAADTSTPRGRDATFEVAPALDDYRTYLLRGSPIFGGANVLTAEVTPGADDLFAVSFRLDPDGSERLRQFTSTHRHERLALLVNRQVVFSARIMSEISGGMLQVSVGGDDPETTRKRAEALVKDLATAASD